jgi:hypothetical protein
MSSDPNRLPPGWRDWRERPIVDDSKFREYQRLAQGSTAAASARNTELLIAALPNCILIDDQPEQAQAREQLRALLADTGQQGRHWDKGGGTVTPR